jgi:hypothetical protein
VEDKSLDQAVYALYVAQSPETANALFVIAKFVRLYYERLRMVGFSEGEALALAAAYQGMLVGKESKA